ncbi:uncharacterized protein [Temnothorax longispinosus]|uniref:uncharacterized protein isoform X1 n=1 Tax=Temnothorax longispinosus TaxID=300112 RepID=UPI003A999883
MNRNPFIYNNLSRQIAKSEFNDRSYCMDENNTLNNINDCRDLITDERLLSNMCRELEGQHRATKSLINDVVKHVQKIMYNKGLDIDISNFDSDKKRKRVYERSGIYLPPQPVVLDSTNIAYFVPFQKLLEYLLQIDEIALWFRKPYKSSSLDGVLMDFCDGIRFEKHPFVRRKLSNAVYLLLYNDDVELANPLGMKKHNRGKLCFFYVVFLNIPVHLRSKLSHIHLLAVGQASHLKFNAAKEKLLSDFLLSLSKLSSEHGLLVQTKNGEETFHGSLLAYTGDALACHNIGGFKESFSKNVKMPCRMCKAQTSDFPFLFSHTQCKLRSEEEIVEFNKQFKMCKTDLEKQQLQSQYEMKSNSFLVDRVPYFSMTKDLLYDPMHILFEGVCNREVTLFLNVCIHDKHVFTRKRLNDRLTAFRFHHSVDSSLYPNLFPADLQYTASASSCLNFMLHFPFILYPLVSGHEAILSEYLDCLIILCQIVQIAVSPVLEAATVGYFEEIISQHHQLYEKCYGAKNVFPKLHMLIHLTEQVKLHGPLRHHWTLRLEGKHAVSKAKKFFNFKNLPFSVAEFLQMNQSFNMWYDSEKPVKKSLYKIGIYTGETFLLPNNIVRMVDNSGVSQNDDDSATALVIKNVTLNEVKFQRGDIITFEECDSFCIGNILKIIEWKDEIFFVCSPCSLSSYIKYMNAFKFKEMSYSVVVHSNKLLSPWPLLKYKIGRETYIIFKHIRNSEIWDSFSC